VFATHLGAARDAAKVGKMLKQVCRLAGVGGGGRSRGGVGIGSSHIGVATAGWGRQAVCWTRTCIWNTKSSPDVSLRRTDALSYQVSFRLVDRHRYGLGYNGVRCEGARRMFL
jgi:hypothetical protein